MDNTRNSAVIKQELINYISSLGITVYTGTKARGNKGFFKRNRIDISKSLSDDDSIKTILHEFAHFIHYHLDKSLKNLTVLFQNDSDKIRNELSEVTQYVDENSACAVLYSKREELNKELKTFTDIIRKNYPDFKPNEKFRAFTRYAGFSDLKYLEKYDKVRVGKLLSSKIYSIENVEKDFPDIPNSFVTYLKLKSVQRQRDRITRKIYKLNKYYDEPTELFARFIEGLYIDKENISEIAPVTFQLFSGLYNKNYYLGLREVFSIVDLII